MFLIVLVNNNKSRLKSQQVTSKNHIWEEASRFSVTNSTNNNLKAKDNSFNF